MRPKSSKPKASAERVVKDIRRATRKQYSAEEKIRIVLAGLRGEDSIAEMCRREGIAQGVYYKWSKDFMEVGKRRKAAVGRPSRQDLPDPDIPLDFIGTASIGVVSEPRP
jgi:transposase-like protein